MLMFALVALLIAAPIAWLLVGGPRAYFQIGAGAAQDVGALMAEFAEVVDGSIDEQEVCFERRSFLLTLRGTKNPDDENQVIVTVAIEGVVTQGVFRVSLRSPLHAFVGPAQEHFRVTATRAADVRAWLEDDDIVERLVVLLPHGQDAEVSLDASGSLTAVLPPLLPYTHEVVGHVDLLLDLAEILASRQERVVPANAS